MRPIDVKILLLDFDGVMTDNTVYVDEWGGEQVRCSRSDGLGITALRELGVPVHVITSEDSQATAARCAKLRIPVSLGCKDKVAEAASVVASYGLTLHQAAFVGNDVNDLPLLRAVGMPISVFGAHPRVRGVAHHHSPYRGGDGAVRDVCDILIKARTM